MLFHFYFKELPDGAIQLMSKYGQQYQCTYPNRVVEDQRERQEEQAAIKTGIPDLLRPMADGPCLQRVCRTVVQCFFKTFFKTYTGFEIK